MNQGSQYFFVYSLKKKRSLKAQDFKFQLHWPLILKEKVQRRNYGFSYYG